MMNEEQKGRVQRSIMKNNFEPFEDVL
jgi:hypothetical protein